MIQTKVYLKSSIVLVVLLTAFLPIVPMAAAYVKGDETPAAPAAYPGIDLRFVHLTSEDGLSTDRVQDILQDSQGFMWFSTHDGRKLTLNRYDPKTE